MTPSLDRRSVLKGAAAAGLMAPVALRGVTGVRGELSIQFGSLDALNGLIERLRGEVGGAE